MCTSCKKLLPLATTGDGNCLLHAASLGELLNIQYLTYNTTISPITTVQVIVYYYQCQCCVTAAECRGGSENEGVGEQRNLGREGGR